MNLQDMACISFWFPRLQASGARVPETRLVTTDAQLWRLLDSVTDAPPDGLGAFIEALRVAAIEVGGYPCFLRTGHGSGKHDWDSTCFVKSAEQIVQHVAALVEWSEGVSLMGLPHKVWAVRKLLPLRSPFSAYRGMPIVKERRYFIEDGRTTCHHPYWPAKAVEQGHPRRGAEQFAHWRELLDALNTETAEEVEELSAVATQVSRHFEGAWSLDFAEALDGSWYAIDMAPAEVSFHWADCPHGKNEMSRHEGRSKPDLVPGEQQ